MVFREVSRCQKTIQPLIAGIYAAALTPMHEDLSCNCQALVDHCNDLMSRGCKGVVLFGTTGEGSSFSVAEREKAITNVIGLGIDPQKVIVAINCCAIEDAVKLASVAVENHCAAVLIAPAFFYKNVSEEGVIDFYKKIIQLVNHKDLRVLLYHIPKYSGVPITLNVINALRKEFPNNIVGIKESEGNLDFTKEILLTVDDFKVFIGHELHISEAVRLGAFAGISGIANAYPELICSLYEYGKDEENPNYNFIAKNKIQALKNYPIFPAIKSIVESQKGRHWHVMRPPLVPLNNQQSQALLESLKFDVS